MNEKYLVTQSNDLIVSRHNLTTAELKIVLTLVSLIQPEDDDFKMYQLKISDFAELLGVTGESQYTYLHKITQDLMQKVIELKNKKRTLQMTWLASADYKYGEGIIELEISQKLRPYLLKLKEHFTSYSLKNVLTLNGKYSIRLYEILKSYEYKKIFIIDLTEFSKILKLSTVYNDFYNIKRRILEPAQKELTEKTDITFDYETITQRKKVIALKFTIKANKKNKAIEPSPQLALPEPKDEINQDTDIQAIKDEFKRLYNAELVDRFVKEMIEVKGIEQVKGRLNDFQSFIKGKQIKNMGGCFKKFVMEDYVKPVSHDGTQRLHPVYVTPPEERERQEKISRGELVPPICNPEVAKEHIKKMRDIVAGKITADS